MRSPTSILLVGLFLVTAAFVYAWWRSASDGKHPHPRPGPFIIAMGAITLFFDTLVIGNYAPTTAMFRMFKMVKDDPAGDGQRAPGGRHRDVPDRQRWIPGGGAAIGFSGTVLAAAAAVNFVLGGLMALGIGSYAPSLIVFSLLGMDPRSAFPIMMGSAAYMIALGGIKFAGTGKYDGEAALGLTMGGIPGVPVAAYLVKSLPLVAIRWLVVVVVLYAGVSLLRTALARRNGAGA